MGAIGEQALQWKPRRYSTCILCLYLLLQCWQYAQPLSDWYPHSSTRHRTCFNSALWVASQMVRALVAVPWQLHSRWLAWMLLGVLATLCGIWVSLRLGMTLLNSCSPVDKWQCVLHPTSSVRHASSLALWPSALAGRLPPYPMLVLMWIILPAAAAVSLNEKSPSASTPIKFFTSRSGWRPWHMC